LGEHLIEAGHHDWLHSGYVDGMLVGRPDTGRGAAFAKFGGHLVNQLLHELGAAGKLVEDDSDLSGNGHRFSR
jgi:hypothetical protein